MQPLQKLLELLCENSKMHICVHDVSGILKNELLDFEYKIHSKDFCSAAKSTPKGLAACLRCKKAANDYGIKSGRTFSGRCIYGVYETGMPVVIDGEVKCIVYVGGCVDDREKLRKRIDKICRLTGVKAEELCARIDNLEPMKDAEKYRAVAEIVGWYITAIPHRSTEKGKYHWAVENIKQYAERYYSTDLSLKKVAALYYINEKYIGRLFKKQIGISFRRYLQKIRIERAVELLKNTNRSINEIALDTGFSDAAYFHRIFFEKYKKTPTEFRRR